MFPSAEVFDEHEIEFIPHEPQLLLRIQPNHSTLHEAFPGVHKSQPLIECSLCTSQNGFSLVRLLSAGVT